MATAFPFLYLAASLAVGILAGSIISLPMAWAIAGLGGALLVGWLALGMRQNWPAFFAVLLAAFFLGSATYSRESRLYETNPVKRFDFNGYADFIGRLYRSPGFAVGRTYLYLRVEKISSENNDIEATGNLRVTVLHPSEYPSPVRLKAGDRIRVSAQVLPARDFRNFGESDLADLRRNQKIHNHAVSKSVLLIERLPGGKRPPFLGWVSSLRRTWQEKIERFFSTAEGTGLSQEGAVLEALLLGERGRLDAATTSSLQKSGLYHIIAISGAHIAIISFLLFSVLKLVRLPRRLCYSILIVVLVSYALLVEGRASVFRAVIMTLVFLIGKLLWKNTQLLNTIAFSAFLLLLSNPFYLFDMGFELTFAATLSIIVFFPPVIRHLPRLPLSLSELFAMSLTAQLGVLPFLARSFHRVTFAGLLLNFLAIPLTGLVMALGFVFLGVSLASSLGARLIVQPLRLMIRLFLWTTGLADSLPALSYRIPTPHLVTIVAYFSFLLLLLLPELFKRQKLLTFALFAASLAVLVTYPFPPRFSRSLEITFLDVGQGDSILVEFPGRKKMLIDAGGVPDDSLDIGELVVSSFLWDRGIKKIDYAVLTHAHPDHLNGLKSVARNFQIGQFWEAVSPPSNPAYEELKAGLSSAVIQRRTFRGFGQQEGRVTIKVIHPQDGAATPAHDVSNDESLALRVSLGDIAFLLPSDIGFAAENDILRQGLVQRAQVLKSPHHGSRTSSSEAFLAAVRPLIVVITAGRGNLYGVPHAETLERYRQLGAKVYRTDRDGAVRVTTDGRTFSVITSEKD